MLYVLLAPAPAHLTPQQTCVTAVFSNAAAGGCQCTALGEDADSRWLQAAQHSLAACTHCCMPHCLMRCCCLFVSLGWLCIGRCYVTSTCQAPSQEI